MPLITQSSFAKGEIAPSLHGRVDTAAYHVALARAKNAIIHTYGGASSRTGSEFLGPCKEHTYAPRLIPFQFKTTDQYIIEAGNLYMRFIRNDGYVTETPLTGATATAANPVVISKGTHGYSDGDEVHISGMTEMVELNGNRYIVANKNAGDFELTHQVTGANIDGTGFTAETTGGTLAKIYEITTTTHKRITVMLVTRYRVRSFRDLSHGSISLSLGCDAIRINGVSGIKAYPKMNLD